MKILVTGGAGYIGSTICSALIEKGHTPVILDSLVSGPIEFTKGRIFYEGDVADTQLLEKIFMEHPDTYATIHCAALLVVPDSVKRPYEYYRENVSKSLILFKNLSELGCERVVFSSSASIYDDSKEFIVTEKSPLNPRSPYARTKYMMELVLEDMCNAYDLRGISLRYFNLIGADPKMRTGAYLENPSHLLGKLIEASQSNDKTFYITGTNWETRDGTGIRDFIHVWDLAMAHVNSVELFDTILDKNQEHSFGVINLGCQNGITVKEFVEAFENVIKEKLNIIETEMRPGDVAGAYTDIAKAREELKWVPKMSDEEGIEHSIEWHKKYFR